MALTRDQIDEAIAAHGPKAVHSAGARGFQEPKALLEVGLPKAGSVLDPWRAMARAYDCLSEAQQQEVEEAVGVALARLSRQPEPS